MTKLRQTTRVPVDSRPSTRQLLRRILETPELAVQVQALAPPVLGRLIDRIGLEDAGELVAFATTDQLAAVFDEDLWRAARAGEDETFDAERFLVWLEVMLEAGDRFVAMKLFELPTDLVTLALHKHLLVLDMDALLAELAQESQEDFDQLEKALSDCLYEELEEYRLIARRHEGWDSLLTAILALDRDHHDYLVTILDRCAKMSSEYIEDNGGLYEVLTSDEMLEGDIAADREDRRAEAGHVAPSSAAAFLKLARMPSQDLAERDPLTKGYFRALARDAALAPAPAPPKGSAPRQDLLFLLRDAEVFEPASPPLLAAEATDDALLRALRGLVEEDVDTFAARSEELAYLANVLASGCEFDGRRLRPAEAVQAALRICNVGLRLAATELGLLGREAEVLASHSADRLFRIAWQKLDDGEQAGPPDFARIQARLSKLEKPREAEPISRPRRTARAVRSARPTRAR